MRSTRIPAGGLDPHARRRGQGLVEFALVLPVFFLVFFGLFDGGRAVYMNSIVSQAAREGARVASVEARWIGSTDPTCGTLGGPVCPASIAALKADVVAAANRMVAPFGSIPSGHVYLSCDTPGNAPTGNWTSSDCTTNNTGNIVSVRVVLTFTAVTPVIAQIIPPLSLAGAATMTIN
jgi:hypothetical protein